MSKKKRQNFALYHLHVIDTLWYDVLFLPPHNLLYRKKEREGDLRREKSALLLCTVELPLGEWYDEGTWIVLPSR